jgi:hypothetical protein
MWSLSLSCGHGAIDPMFLPSSPGFHNKWYQSHGSTWWEAEVDPSIGSTIGCEKLGGDSWISSVIRLRCGVFISCDPRALTHSFSWTSPNFPTSRSRVMIREITYPCNSSHDNNVIGYERSRETSQKARNGGWWIRYCLARFFRF